ncbi:hypothetical protein BDV93DRAFT_511865 [Ceratobasidium sp. AG-I]|nr:hypothetical protein BDV93DRAFT_511865 [Ceratobasidium sp. AG-I]
MDHFWCKATGFQANPEVSTAPPIRSGALEQVAGLNTEGSGGVMASAYLKNIITARAEREASNVVQTFEIEQLAKQRYNKGTNGSMYTDVPEAAEYWGTKYSPKYQKYAADTRIECPDFQEQIHVAFRGPAGLIEHQGTPLSPEEIIEVEDSDDEIIELASAENHITPHTSIYTSSSSSITQVIDLPTARHHSHIIACTSGCNGIPFEFPDGCDPYMMSWPRP